MGSDVKGKNVLIVDDMIASGGSIIEVATKLREMGAHKISITTTFALFTEGFTNFQNAKNQGLFDNIYTTNLSYIPEEITNNSWFYAVDMSMLVAKIINSMDNKEPLTAYLDRKRETFKDLQKKKIIK